MIRASEAAGAYWLNMLAASCAVWLFCEENSFERGIPISLSCNPTNRKLAKINQIKQNKTKQIKYNQSK
jgi:hypothetical protein